MRSAHSVMGLYMGVKFNDNIFQAVYKLPSLQAKDTKSTTFHMYTLKILT